MKYLLIPALLLSLPGCANNTAYGPDSPYYNYPTTTTLSLEQPIEIPPESATVRLQFGRTVARNGVQEEEPHCVFEVNTVKESSQTIVPGVFLVTDIQRRIQTFSGMPVLPWRYAFRRTGFGRDDGPSHIYYITEFRLHSDKQPDVRALTCLHNQMAPGIPVMRHLTLAQIRQALGSYFSLTLAP